MTWRIDTRIPLALILTLVLNTAGTIYFFGQLTNRVSNLEEDNKITRARFSEYDAGRLMMRERVSKLEEGLANIRELLRSMDGKLDHLQDARSR